jgi:predicted small lipoprotein YifL
MCADRSASAARRATFTVITVMLLSACGQRGPLMLPDAPAASTPAAAIDDQTDNDDEGDGER